MQGRGGGSQQPLLFNGVNDVGQTIVHHTGFDKKWGAVLQACLHGCHVKQRGQRNHHTAKRMLLQAVSIVAMHLDAITGLGF